MNDLTSQINLIDGIPAHEDLWDVESCKIVAIVKAEHNNQFKTVKYDLNGMVLETYYMKHIDEFDQKIKNLWDEEYFNDQILCAVKDGIMTDIHFWNLAVNQDFIKKYNLDLTSIHNCTNICFRYTPQGEYIGSYYCTNDAEKTLKDYFKNNTAFIETVLNFYQNQNRKLEFLAVKDFGNRHVYLR